MMRKGNGMSPHAGYRLVIEKHEDGYVAYAIGLPGVVVGQGNTYEEALSDIQSAVGYHLKTFGVKRSTSDG